MDKQIKAREDLITTEYSNITGIAINKNGQNIYEAYFNGYTPDDTTHIMSVTKSILSALIGIAIDNNYIQSPDQKVLDFFHDYKPKRGEKTIQDVTIKNLLTMTAPYKYKSEPYTKVYSSPDWVQAALDLLGGRAGITGEFKYSTVGVQILSGILVNATGMPIADFAAERLFTPLGIKKPRNIVLHNKEEHFAFLKECHPTGWVIDPKGVNTAGWGLCLSPRDMVKIGELYRNGGVYDGKRLLSSAWIEESTREQSRWGEMPYGYLWWLLEIGGNHCYAAIGDAGNIILVNPRKALTVAITSCFILRQVPIMELLTEQIVPVFA